MIIVERKPLSQIFKLIEKYKKVLILGCRGCAGVCLTGGEREVKKLASVLKIARQREGSFLEVRAEVLIRQCDVDILRTLPKIIGDSEAVISMACGVGVNLIADMYPEIKVYPGVDTLFLGAHVSFEKWEEKCRACGECIIDKTAGLCPIVRCPKGLLNGPCGGSQTERCEINPEIPCVWYEIVMRLEKRGELDVLDEITPPKNWGLSYGQGPRIRIKGEGNDAF